MPLVLKTGTARIDGLLWGVKWSMTSMSFAFPTSASQYVGYPAGAIGGFQTFAETQKDAVRGILAQLGEFIPITFTETINPAEANLRFAEATSVDQDGSGHPGPFDTAFGTPPDIGTAPPYGWGDSFFNTTDYDDPVRGNYAYLTMIHEVGHALGLKHGHVRQYAPEGGSILPKLPSAVDSVEFSVMTYRSTIGGTTDGSYTNEPSGYPQSFMMLDIAALQYLYGANWASRSGDTVYSWKPDSGETFIDGVSQGRTDDNRIFLTIWDGGGNDTYDFSAYATSLKINLSPGQWCQLSREQTALLDADRDIHARANVFNALLYKGDTRSLIENANGGSGNDAIGGNIGNNLLSGHGGDDRLSGRRGNDVLCGGEGHDTLIGGPGADSFVYYALDRDGSDIITDFRRGDRLLFDLKTFGALGEEEDGTGRLEASHFLQRPDNAAQDGDDFFIFRTADRTLWFDHDGNGAEAAVMIAAFKTGPSLSATDLAIFA